MAAERDRLKKAVKELMDRPLDVESEELLVDREEELFQLGLLPEYYEGGIIGVAGERGIGKTSLFNLARFPGKEKVMVKVIDRENKVTVLWDIVDELEKYAKRKGLKKVAEELMEVGKVLAKWVAFIWKGEWIEEEEKRFGEVVREISKILKKMGGDVVVVLDEIDKERKDEILLVVDAIKEAFKNNSVTLIVALPYTIYEEVLRGVAEGKETYNLENVFDNIIAIKPLKDGDIKSLIEKRMPGLVDNQAKELLVDFSRGNPRRAIRALKEAGILAVMEGNEKIEEKHVKAVLRRLLRPLWENIGERGQRVLKALPATYERLRKKTKLSLGTLYNIVEMLEKRGLVEKRRSTRLGRLLVTLFP